jgi:hypothetical protein
MATEFIRRQWAGSQETDVSWSPSSKTGRHRWRPITVAVLIACGTRAAGTAPSYPLTLTAQAVTKTDKTTVTSTVTIRVEKLMEESRRVRVTDALKYGGYANFLNVLRLLPAIGSLEVEGRVVELRFAHEQQVSSGRRLVLIADHPLFFLGNPSKPRAGYELAIVELLFDAQGGATGTVAGAARVRPSPDGVTVDDFMDTLVHLTVPAGRP